MNQELKWLAENGIHLDFKTMHTTDPQKIRTLFLSKLKGILQALEEGGKEYKTAGEVAISHFITTALKSGCVFFASAESNSRGHVDITVTAPSFSESTDFKVKAEAKIWNGAKYQKAGFEQLEGYLTGSPQTGLLLYYFRDTTTCDDKFSEFIDDFVKEEGGKVLSKKDRNAATRHTHPGQFSYTLDHFAAWIR